MENLSKEAYLIEGEAWEKTLETCIEVTRLSRTDNSTGLKWEAMREMGESAIGMVGIEVSSWAEEGDYVSMKKLLGAFLEHFDKIDPVIVGEAYKEAHKVRDRIRGGKILMYKLASKLEPEDLERRTNLREVGLTDKQESYW